MIQYEGDTIGVLLLASLVFTSGYKYWLLSQSPSIRVFNLIGVIFILYILLRVIINNEGFSIGSGINYVYLWWGWLVLIIFSSLLVIITSPTGKSFFQLFKGFLIVLQKCLIITGIYIFFKKSRHETKRLIFWIYLLGVLISTLYIYFQLVSTINGNNFDVEVWNFLSYGRPWNQENMVSEYFYGGFFRFSGVSGPQPQSYYIVTAVPLFIGLYSEYSKRVYLLISVILSMGLVFTFSRSGILALSLSLIIFTTLSFIKGKSKGFIKRSLWLPVGILVSSLALYLLYIDTVNSMIEARLSSSSRVVFYSNMSEILSTYPLGVGYNNFSVLYSEYFFRENFNPHSSWFRYLLELGPIGLFYRLVFVAYIIYTLYKQGDSFLSISIISSILGLSFAALFNMVFDIYFIYIFLTIAYLYAIEFDSL